MGMNAINWMAKQKTGDDKSKSALFWLAFHMNDKTGECFPSISTLQAEMEVKSDNTVRSALRRLRDAGLISWERETRDGLTVKTKYRLHMHGSMTAGTSADKGTSTIAVPQPLKGGASTVEGGTSTIAGGVPQPLRTNREIEQGINREQNKEVMCAPSGNSSANAAVASAQAQTPYPDDFDKSLFDEAQREAQLAGEKTTDEPPMKEEKPKRKRSSNVQKPESVSEQVWNDFTALRTKRRAPITETALKGIQREAEKAGITLEEALSTCCERGWQGFKAEWYRREKLEQKNASKAEYQLPSNDDWDNFDTAHYA
ncbi:helix-turn-helix domain-containing protein [Sutterella wadsworthensis]